MTGRARLADAGAGGHGGARGLEKGLPDASFGIEDDASRSQTRCRDGAAPKGESGRPMSSYAAPQPRMTII